VLCPAMPAKKDWRRWSRFIWKAIKRRIKRRISE